MRMQFSIGQPVVYFPPRGQSAHPGAYRVTDKVTMPSGQVAYRIRHQFEEYDRVAAEDDLSVLWN